MKKKIKLKSGKEITIKDIGVDDRDMLLDSVKYIYNSDGEFAGVENMQSTITKWIRTVVENSDDKFILSLSLEDRTEIFVKLQEALQTGEGNASN